MVQSGDIVGSYRVAERIGSGSYATVWRARHVEDFGRLVAIKAVDVQRLVKSRKDEENMEREIAIMQSLSHPHIVQLFSHFRTQANIFLVMEHCETDLYSYVRKRGALPLGHVQELSRQLADGLRVMRDQRMIHRDLKPHNLLLATPAGGGAPVLKIADFGFARFVEKASLAETLCGSPLYMAPEVLKGYKYGPKADLWSVGCIMFQMLTKRTPFNGENQVDLLRTIETTSWQIPPGIAVSEPCRDLLERLLQPEPSRRMGDEDFFAHPFLQTLPTVRAWTDRQPAQGGKAASDASPPPPATRARVLSSPPVPTEAMGVSPPTIVAFLGGVSDLTAHQKATAIHATPVRARAASAPEEGFEGVSPARPPLSGQSSQDRISLTQRGPWVTPSSSPARLAGQQQQQRTTPSPSDESRGNSSGGSSEYVHINTSGGTRAGHRSMSPIGALDVEAAEAAALLQARRAQAIVEVAGTRAAAGASDDAMVLNLCALKLLGELLAVANDNRLGPAAKELCENAREAYGRSLEQAEEMHARCRREFRDDHAVIDPLRAERVLFVAAMQWGQDAAVDELLADKLVAKRLYAKAVALLEYLAESAGQATGAAKRASAIDALLVEFRDRRACCER